MRRLDIHLRGDEAFSTVMAIVKAAEPVDWCVVETEQKDRQYVSVLVRDGTGQFLMDNIQTALEGREDWRITLVPIEATVPSVPVDETKRARRQQAVREELYQDIAHGAELHQDFMIMVVLSTIVAAIGLNSNSVAAVIGAMVIAPLLGPILGFAFGAAIGDFKLLKEGAQTLVIGIAIALLSAIILSFVMPVDMGSRELLSRAEVRLDGMALSLAAGGAAALALTRGGESTLVGVMVAAALLPPTAAVGLFIGEEQWGLASRAGLLLVLNVACLVVSALVVMHFKKIRPRTWLERKNAARAVNINIAVAVISLIVMVFLIVFLNLGETVSFG